MILWMRGSLLSILTGLKTAQVLLQLFSLLLEHTKVCIKIISFKEQNSYVQVCCLYNYLLYMYRKNIF